MHTHFYWSENLPNGLVLFECSCGDTALEATVTRGGISKTVEIDSSLANSPDVATAIKENAKIRLAQAKVAREVCKQAQSFMRFAARKK